MTVACVWSDWLLAVSVGMIAASILIIACGGGRR